MAEFNRNISISEVKQAAVVKCVELMKSFSLNDILNNDVFIAFVHILMNVCFTSASVPTMWGKGLINPIPKLRSTVMRDPVSDNDIPLSNPMNILYS